MKTAEIASSGAVGPSLGDSHGRRTAARLRAIGSPTAVAWATDSGWRAYPPQNDSSDEVRGEAMTSLPAMVPIEQALAFYNQRLQQNPPESTLWGIMSLLYDHKRHPQARQILQSIANSPNEGLRNQAREYLQ